MNLNTTDRSGSGQGTRKTKRAIKRIAIGATLIVIGLVVLVIVIAPMIANSVAPGIIEKSANKTLKGTVDVSSVRVSWSGPQVIGPITLRDPDGTQVATLEGSADVGLLTLIQGSLDLSTIHLSGKANIIASNDGSTNLQRALESRFATTQPSPNTPRYGSGSSGTTTNEPIRLPEGLRAKLKIDNTEVTFTGPIGPNGEVRTIGLKDVEASGSFANAEPVTLSIKAKTVDGADAINAQFDADKLSNANGELDMASSTIKGTIDVTIPGEYAEMLAASAMNVSEVPSGPQDPVRVSLAVKNEGSKLVLADPGRPAFISARLPAAVTAMLSDQGTKVTLASRPHASVMLSALELPLPKGNGVPIDWRNARAKVVLRVEPTKGTVALPGESTARSFAVDPVDITIFTSNLEQGVSAHGDIRCTYDGANSGTITLQAEASDLLDAATGVFAPDAPGLVTSSIKVRALPTALVQMFVPKEQVDLMEVLGDTAVLDVTAGRLSEAVAKRLAASQQTLVPSASTHAGDHPDTAEHADPIEPIAQTFVTLTLQSKNTSAWLDVLIDPSSVRARNQGVQVQSDALGYFLRQGLATSNIAVSGKPGIVLNVEKFEVPLNRENKPDLARITGNLRFDAGDFTLTLPARNGRAPTTIAVETLDTSLAIQPNTPATLTLNHRASADNQPITAQGTLRIHGLVEALAASSTGKPLDASSVRPEGTITIGPLPTSLAALASPESEQLARAALGNAASLTIEAIKSTQSAGSIRLSMTSDNAGLNGSATIDNAGVLKTTADGLVATLRDPAPVMAQLAKAGPGQTILNVESAAPLTLAITNLNVPLKGADAAKNATATLTLSTKQIGVDVAAPNGASERIGVDALNATIELAPTGDGSLKAALTGDHAGKQFGLNADLALVGLRTALAANGPADAHLAPGGANDSRKSSNVIELPVDLRKLRIRGSAEAHDVPTTLASLVGDNGLLSNLVGPSLAMNLRAADTSGVNTIDMSLSGANLNASTALKIDAGAVSVGPTNAKATVTPDVAAAFIPSNADNSPAPSLAQTARIELTASAATLPLVDGRTIDISKVGPVNATLTAPTDIVVNNVTAIDGKSINAGVRGLQATAKITPSNAELAGDVTLNASLFDPADPSAVVAAINGDVSLPAGAKPFNITLNASDSSRLDRWLGRTDGLVSRAVGSSLTAKASASQSSNKALSIAADVQSPKFKATAQLARHADGSMSLTSPADVKWTIDPELIDTYVFTPSAGKPVPAPEPLPPALSKEERQKMPKEQRRAYRAQRESEEEAYAEAVARSRLSTERTTKGPSLHTSGPVDLDLKIDKLAIGPTDHPLDPVVFELGTNVTIKQLAFTSREGTPIDLGSISGNVTSLTTAEGSGVRFKLASTGSAKFSSEGSIEKISNQSGAIATERAQITSTTTGQLPTALIDALGGQDGKLVDLLGAQSNVSIKTTSLSKTSGDLDAKFDSENTNAHIAGTIQNGTLVTRDPGTVEVTRISTQLTDRYIQTAIPIIDTMEKTATDKPSVVTTSGLVVPLDGDTTKLTGVIDVDLGSVRYQTSNFFTKLLTRAGHEEIGTSATIQPFKINIKRGVARYERISIPAPGYSIETQGKINLNTNELDVTVWVPLFALADDVGRALGGVPGLSRATMVPIRVSGPSSDPKTEVDGEAFLEGLPASLLGGVGDAAQGVGDAAGNAATGVGGIIGGLLGGDKDNEKDKDKNKDKNKDDKKQSQSSPAAPPEATKPAVPPSSPNETQGEKNKDKDKGKGKDKDKEKEKDKEKNKKKKGKDGKEPEPEPEPSTGD